MLSLDQAFAKIKSGDRVFIHGGAATPQFLVQQFVEKTKHLVNIEIIHLHTECDPIYARAEYSNNYKVRNLFVGANMRPFFNFDNVDYLPCFLSQIPSLFRSGKRKPNVALVQVSPPDSHGYCSLGTSVDVARAAVDTADLVIAQVNNFMPRTLGDGIIAISKIHCFIENHQELPQASPKPLSEVESKIGSYVASLIEDSSTLQMGIGGIPDAVLASLKNHKNLGVHTEMFTDGLIPLLESGVVNNSQKAVHAGKTVSSFVIGTHKVFDFINDNPSVLLLDVAYVNSPLVIAKNKKVVAINSAVEIDLTGQVCADSVGHQIISGVGGQLDFIQGATLSEGGKPIIAMPSRTKHGFSRIVSTLKAGAGVVTTRAHVHYVVTEFGIADLFGLSLGERAKALIAIAHPEDREDLQKQWFQSIKKIKD